MRILVADDDVFFLRVTEDILKGAGHEVITARSGDAALEKVFEIEPDLVVLDIVMPGMFGTDVSKELRLDKRTRVLPILLVSTGLDEFSEAGGDPKEYLADDFLHKPFKPEVLLARVDRLRRLGLKRLNVHKRKTVQMPKVDERRIEPRAPIDIEITARTAKALLHHPMLNISSGGVCFEPGQPLDEDAEIELRFVLPGGQLIAARGVVAWCLEVEEESRWSAGIRFTEIRHEDVAAIVEYTRALLRVVRPAGAPDTGPDNDQ